MVMLIMDDMVHGITREELAGRILVIDPTSPEPNRGSYCYLPYIFYNYLKETHNDKVILKENFTLPDMDGIFEEMYGHIFVALWSYPQIEMCNYLYRTYGEKVHFFGYDPLIEHLRLPGVVIENHMIFSGMCAYPKYYDKFQHLLLSDCDQHIKKPGEPPITMVPLFTSYGCPRRCKFCSATANQSSRIGMSVPHAVDLIQQCHEQGRHNIHFTDEDFFYDAGRAYNILEKAVEMSDQWQFIALAHLDTLDKFINYVAVMEQPETAEKIWNSLRLIEVGLETADDKLARQMGKRGVSGQDKAVSVAKKCPSPILWLTMTFFPGETVGSLNRTGQFLKEYGLPIERMSPRIVTNGTVGGLGQFFQFYHGCGMSESALASHGMILTERPMRLLPSFIPYSFLMSNFVTTVLYRNKENRGEVQELVDFYVNTYKLNKSHVRALDCAIRKYLHEIMTPTSVVELTLEGNRWYNHYVDAMIYIAILARLNLIVEA